MLSVNNIHKTSQMNIYMFYYYHYNMGLYINIKSHSI